MEYANIILSVINDSNRVDKFNDELFLKQCYGNKLIADQILIDADDESRILFFIDGYSWTLDDHEIAISLCSILPNPFLKAHYLENDIFEHSELYKQVFNFLQTK